MARISALAATALAGVVAHDLRQRQHAILRNFPVVGHVRYWLESIGPELRQYIVTSNDEERPFSRDQRRWVYASSKREINTFGFGSDNDMEQVDSLIVFEQTPFPVSPPADGEPGGPPDYRLPAGKVLGAAHGRRHAFRPESLVNVSGMSYGSLSPVAVEAINRGAALAGCLHNTGEGGLAPAHLHGGELVFQIGTGYFGCRDARGRFSLARLEQRLAEAPVKAIEIKLSQGAKPGLGGLLPAPKVTEEIAAIRGVPAYRDCASPAAHTAFGDVDGLIEFVERLAAATGLPVGVKSAVGDLALGCDMVNVGREAMLAVGCIQAMRCHTDACPTGVATQNRWLMHGLDPELKSARAANYIVGLRSELLALARACGARHPALVDPGRIEIVGERYAST